MPALTPSPAILESRASWRTEERQLRDVRSDELFRLVLLRPDSALMGKCLIAQSGTSSAIDEISFENRLLGGVAQVLASRGVLVARFDMPAREDRGRPASDEHRSQRVMRLRTAYDVLARTAPGPTAFIGLSLGGEAVLRLVSKPGHALGVCSLVLVGCVVDEPTVVAPDVRDVHLMFGERDVVRYLRDNGTMLAEQRAEEFAPRSLRNIVALQACSTRWTVLPNAGHLLSVPGDPDGETPIRSITDAVVRALLGAGP